MLTLLFFLVSGLVGYGISRAAQDAGTSPYRPDQLALPPPPPPIPFVPAMLSLTFSGVANGTDIRTYAVVFFELNRPGSTCAQESLEIARQELQALGGAAMLHWATYAPYQNPTEELISRFQEIRSSVAPLSRIVVSDIRGLPPALKPPALPPPTKPSATEVALDELREAQFTALQLRQAIIESQKLYPELWEDEDTRSILENRIHHLLGTILHGDSLVRNVSSYSRRNARNADLWSLLQNSGFKRV